MKRRPALTLLLLLLVPGTAGLPAPVPNGDWEATLARVVPAVVALRVAAPRPFDTEEASVTVATGFVVDARQGLVLTNRHVVQPGPVVAEAVFLDHEQVPVRAVYRDPVHDFGFYRFDPDAVRFMDVGELELAPQAARVGVEVRVVGNDAGEKLSILDGTLARLDRDAPDYGRGRYNDFNTFYLQAASSSSGGSSGSPVVDRDGRVVGLAAGGNRRSASSFFLPLDRVVRALEHVQRGEVPPRGTLQAVFRHRPYDELRRLGLSAESEAQVRRGLPDRTGLLVVAETVPGGPAFGVLEPGDVLLAVEGRRLADFASLESVLDGRVGQEVRLTLSRGGALLERALRVDDLHATAPSEYLEFGGGILHALSYQQARHCAHPAGGVFLAASGYAFGRAGVSPGALVTSVDGVAVPDLDAFEAEVAARPDGAPLRVGTVPLDNSRSPEVHVIRVDRRWFTMQRCRRDDATGLWPCRTSPAPPPPQAPAPATTSVRVEGARPARALAPSLVRVDFDVPFLVDGVQGTTFTGAGLVVDAQAGLVVVDRDTVPVAIGDAEITFGGSVVVPGEVVALHPEHNLAVLRYEPRLVGDTEVRPAELRPGPLRPDDPLWLVVLTPDQELVARETRVARAAPARLPLPRVPRFRETNAELVTVTESLSSVGGALTDSKGRVRALWASFSADARGSSRSFFAGLPVEIVAEWVEPLRRGERPRWRSLGAELDAIPLAEARARGLAEAEAQRLEARDPLRRRVLVVRRVFAGTPAAERLAAGDLVLRVDGAPVTRFREIEEAAQRRGEAGLVLTVLREGALAEVHLPTSALEGDGAHRLVAWAGALLQAPPAALARQRGQDGGGVYVAARWNGSPAQRHGLPATLRVTAVDGLPTPDLDAFLAVVADRRDRESVRLRTVDLGGRTAIRTLDLDLQYWPTVELRRGAAGWERRVLARSPAAAALPPR